MNSLTVKGKQPFMGKEIPIVLGGFGPDQKCVCDKTIAEIHGMETKNVRARVTDNIKRFREDVDFIDLKNAAYRASNFTICSQLSYSKAEISRADHIYILSERGYGKLIKIMDTDQAWDIYENLQDQYFELRDGDKTESLSDPTENMLASAKLKNSEARKASLYVKMANNPSLTDKQRQLLLCYGAKELNDGIEVFPLPKSQKGYSATEIGGMFGITAQAVGIIANSNGLKVDEYGELRKDKSKYGPTEVDNFYYFDSAIPVFKPLAEKWKADHEKKSSRGIVSSSVPSVDQQNRSYQIP